MLLDHVTFIVYLSFQYHMHLIMYLFCVPLFHTLATKLFLYILTWYCDSLFLAFDHAWMLGKAMKRIDAGVPSYFGKCADLLSEKKIDEQLLTEHDTDIGIIDWFKVIIHIVTKLDLKITSVGYTLKCNKITDI